jgi:hypothetical protein
MRVTDADEELYTRAGGVKCIKEPCDMKHL